MEKQELETVEQFLSRGGKITVYPMSKKDERGWDKLKHVNRFCMKRVARIAGTRVRADVSQGYAAMPWGKMGNK
jgi:hypothetical protein